MYYMSHNIISPVNKQKISKDYTDDFKSFMQNIESCQKNMKSRTIININGQVMEPVGDAELETEFIQTTTDNTTISTTSQNQLNEDDLVIYKRDFMILNIFDPNKNIISNDDKNFGDKTKYITFGVYALAIGAITKVMTLKIPLYSEVAILDMYESTLNPYDIINFTYQYQTSKNRTLVLKRSNAIIAIPRRDFLNNLDLMQTPRPDNLLSTDINYDEMTVPMELMELAILIRSNNYISNINRETLLEFALNITIF
jgi:hypothetical protein